MALRFEIKKKKIIPTLTGSDATNIPVPMSPGRERCLTDYSPSVTPGFIVSTHFVHK